MKRLLSKRLCALATLALVGTHLYAATVHPSEWTSLVTQAKLAAAVPVLVDVADVSLVELKYQGESNRAKSERYAANLLDELGAEAWRESSVVSPAGQVSAYVTARGLQLLRNSSNALAFRAGKEWFQTTRLHRSGEALALLRRRAVESGSVDVVVTLNVDGMGFWHSSSGAHGLEAPPETLKELSALTSKLQKRLLSIPGSKAGVMLADYATRQPSGANDATVTLRVTERELAALGTSESVRDIHAIDDTQDDFGPFYVSPKALADAEKSGQVEIIVALRSPIKRGHSSEKSDAIHLASVRAIMEDVKKKFGGLPGLIALPGVNALTGLVSRDELKQLQASADPRIASISHNYSVGEPPAHVSNAQMNTQLLWNTQTTKGFITGSGAVVAILDTGIKKNHQAMLNKFGTASRVVREACFGTTNSVYLSPCPGVQDSNFDSVGPGTGEPAHCYGSAACSHGTSVAGIAAGGGVFMNTNTGTAFRSMAYEADIWSYQVFSRQRGTTGAFAQAADVLAALNRLVQELPSSSVVEITVSSSNFPGTCTDTYAPVADRAVYNSVRTAVNTLYDRGVAVVAPTGNDHYKGEVGFPACIDKVVKVLGMPNDGRTATEIDGITIDGQKNSRSSNLPSAVHLATGYVWIAPGGDERADNSVGVPNPVTTIWMPAADSITASVASKGTSYAAPHVAGAFALYKSASYVSSTVAEVANYLTGAGRLMYVNSRAVTDGQLYFRYNAIRFKSL